MKKKVEIAGLAALVSSVIAVGSQEPPELYGPSSYQAATAGQERLRRESNRDTDSKQKSEDFNFIALGFAIIVGICFVYFTLRCPACGKTFGLKATRKIINRNGGKPSKFFTERNRYEYKCKRCGHKKWKSFSSG